MVFLGYGSRVHFLDVLINPNSILSLTFKVDKTLCCTELKHFCGVEINSKYHNTKKGSFPAFNHINSIQKLISEITWLYTIPDDFY